MTVLHRLLRLFFKHLYSTFAWAYDFVAAVVSLGQWGNWQKIGLGALPTQGVTLEIGHGPGHVMLQLRQGGHAIVGVDSSKQMARLTARRFRRAGFQPLNARAVAQALPFADQCFSAVFATFPSDFIFQPETLAGIWRVLRPGGEVIVVLGARITGGSILERGISWLYRVTSEAIEPEQRWADPFRNQGFMARLDEIDHRRANVIRIVGVKPIQAGSLRP